MREDGEDYSVGLPSDWRKFHLDNVKKLDREKVLAAVEFMQYWLKCGDYSNYERLKAQASVDPEWWTAHHFGGMMAVRNALRSNGFGEKEFGIENWDDYAVGIVELALGVTQL
jgi:hypothetical protein